MLKLICLFFTILCINKGITAEADIPDIVKDGLLRSRASNIERCNKYILWAFINEPSKDILLTALADDYNIGLLAVTAKDKCVSDNLLEIINYNNTEQLLSTVPYISIEINSFGKTLSIWVGTYYADSGRMFKRSFITTSLTTFHSNMDSTDFGNPDLAAQTINLAAVSTTQGFSENGDLVSPDEIGLDGRILIAASNYFKGTFENICEITNKDFNLPCGETIQVAALHLQGSYRYSKRDDLNVEILEIPFKGADLKLRVVKPQSSRDIANILNMFKNVVCYEEAFEDLIETQLDIFIPEIEIHKNFDLIKNSEQELNNTKISDIELEEVYENANDARLTQVKINLRMIINRDCYPTDLTGFCTEQNENCNRVDLDYPFIYYIITESQIIMLGGIYSGQK